MANKITSAEEFQSKLEEILKGSVGTSGFDIDKFVSEYDEAVPENTMKTEDFKIIAKGIALFCAQSLTSYAEDMVKSVKNALARAYILGKYPREAVLMYGIDGVVNKESEFFKTEFKGVKKIEGQKPSDILTSLFTGYAEYVNSSTNPNLDPTIAAENAQLTNQVRELKKQVEKLQNQPVVTVENNGKIDELKQQINELEAQIAAYNGVTPEQIEEELRIRQEEYDRLASELEKGQSTLADDQGKLEEDKKALEAEQKKYEEERKELESAQAELQIQQADLEQKQKEYEELVASGVSKDALEAVKADLDAKNAELEAAKKEIEEKKAEVENLNSQLTDLRTQFEADKTAAEAAKAAAEAKLKDEQAKVKDAEAAKAAAEAKLKDEQTKVKDAETAIDEAQEAAKKAREEKTLVETTREKDIENAKLKYHGAVKDATREFGIELKEKTDKDGKPVLDSSGSPVIEAVAVKGGAFQKYKGRSKRRGIAVGALSAILTGALVFGGLATKNIIDLNDKVENQDKKITELATENDILKGDNATLNQQVTTMTPGYTEYTEIESWLNGMIAAGNIPEDFFKDYTVVDEQGNITISDASGLTQYIYDAAQDTITAQNADLAEKQAQIEALSDEAVTLGAINNAAVSFFQDALADGYITDEEYDVFVDEETVTNEETGESEITYSVDTSTLFANDGMLYSLFADAALTEAKLNTLEEGLASTLEIVGVVEETDENGKVVSYKTLDDYAVTDEYGSVTYDSETMVKEINETLTSITDKLITATSGEVAEVSDEAKVLMDAANGIVEKVGSMADQINTLTNEKSEREEALEAEIAELTTENERLQGIINSSTKEDTTTDETIKDTGENSGSNVGETSPETPEDSYGPSNTTESGDGSNTSGTDKNKQNGVIVERE